VPEDVIRAVHDWDDNRARIGGIKQAIARWKKERDKLGTGKELAAKLGISSTSLYQLLSKRRREL